MKKKVLLSITTMTMTILSGPIHLHGMQKKESEKEKIENLFNATEVGNLALVKKYIGQEKIDVNITAPETFSIYRPGSPRHLVTPLHIAALKGYLDIVIYLVEEEDANIDAKNKDGSTPLHFASCTEHLDIVKYLSKKKGANIETKGKFGFTSLLFAVFQNQLKTVKYLVEEQNANIEATDEIGNLPLHFAASEGYFDIVKYLIDKKNAYIEAKNKRKFTPFHCATYGGNLDIVQYLAGEKNANIEEKGECDITPLYFAVIRNHVKIVTYLVEKQGANIYAKLNINGENKSLSEIINPTKEASIYLREKIARNSKKNLFKNIRSKECIKKYCWLS